MRPGDEAELAAMLRDAEGPLAVRGGGTRVPCALAGTVLETGGLSGITLYEPGALTLVVRAGTPLAEVEAALARENQRLAFEPPDLRGLLGRGGASTIGGVAAANASGPRRVQAGACRDYMLGVRFVDGAGMAVANGGRVMKNVTGYDLVKLLAGSHGTLGVLTEVAFKVLPVPETEATLRLTVPGEAAAVAAMAAALGSPYEVTGAAFTTPHWGNPGEVLLRIEGFSRSVAYRAERLAHLLTAHGIADIDRDPAASAALWRGLRDVTAFHDMPFVARLSLRPSQVAGMMAGVARAHPCTALLDWGGGLAWVAADEGLDGGGAGRLLSALHRAAAQAGGHATLVKGADLVGDVPLFQPQPPAVAALAAGLRAQFDPRGILNPGLMG
ncbi:FAD-binding protein [Ruixingdingia sedimenti]|uniref:FAD-binding protein n=1 Tax=Ruixingdingia sedimenti TaxID=3073604 RepID=A0ABU1F8Y3_9RHOB|nr:FAD-binding protein [Xinfangfangia sp. LG-4]MDR5653340.1 FAD-binding protein [Xinfangfangia sp. LG-4]